MPSNKTPSKIDPYAKREAKNYQNPIASREYLLDLIAKQSAPVNLKHLALELDYVDEEQIEGLRRRLHAMVRDGQIFKNRRDGFLDFSHMDLVKGRIQAHADGFGFLIPEDGSKDIFMPARQMTKLLNGDIVAVKINQFDERKNRREGELVKIVLRAHTTIIGRYFEGTVRYVTPDDKRLPHDILISNESTLNANHEDIVVVEITEYPRYKHQAVGIIKQVLGEDNAPGMEVTIALNTHDIPHQWNSNIDAEIALFKDKVPKSETKNRLDLTKKPFVTIDGSDARDFDDAVYCEKHASGFTLWVAIADVSHYVKLGTALDTEAVTRGTSVYFPGEVIPMLPEVLSNGLCSLNPHVDRLTMVCEMNIGSQGAIKDYQFHQAVIHSHHRLTYDQASAITFDNQDSVEGIKNVAEVKSILEPLNQVFRSLQKARKRRNALEFDTKEVFFAFNKQRKIEAIKPVQRNQAHQLIEECMVSANICAAKFLKKNKIPTLFRNHAGPNSKKIEDLHTFLGLYGLKMTGNAETPSAEDYALMIESIKPRPDFAVIQTVLLRSMLQASYSPEKTVGHFGLSLKDYAHFTSPIRRYPDLLVHRGIRHIINGGQAADFNYDLSQMEKLGESCSIYERRADEATRDAADYLKCEYLSKHIGESFSGIVTAVTSFGLFVQINNLMIDGLVHITSLARDYYQFDSGKQRLIGEKTGQTFRLGDALNVELVRVDMQDKKIDFILVEDQPKAEIKKIKAKVKKEKLEPSKPSKPSKKKPEIKPKSKASSQTESIYKKASNAITTEEKQPKKAKKKIKLSKQEKKTKAKKERKEAVKEAKPKHLKRKNKDKGKPNRAKKKNKSNAIPEIDPSKI